jgi:hypothetical protein
VKPFHKKKLLSVAMETASSPASVLPRMRCVAWAAVSLDGFVAKGTAFLNLFLL